MSKETFALIARGFAQVAEGLSSLIGEHIADGGALDRPISNPGGAKPTENKEEPATGKKAPGRKAATKVDEPAVEVAVPAASTMVDPRVVVSNTPAPAPTAPANPPVDAATVLEQCKKFARATGGGDVEVKKIIKKHTGGIDKLSQIPEDDKAGQIRGNIYAEVTAELAKIEKPEPAKDDLDL